MHLEEFEGPFDLLLSLIAKHRLDVTVLALRRVVDDFVAHLRTRGPEWDLDETTEFLVVAATLLDLKAARLLPSGRSRTRTTSRCWRRATCSSRGCCSTGRTSEVADVLAQRLAAAGRRHPRVVPLEPQFASLLPEVLLGLGPEEFAALAARALAPRPPAPAVSTAHVHAPQVSIREQAAILTVRLRRHQTSTFRRLAADADSTLVVVGRFLALLELFRGGMVTFDQDSPLGELRVRWVGPLDGAVDLDPTSDDDTLDPGHDAGPDDQDDPDDDVAAADDRPVEPQEAPL